MVRSRAAGLLLGAMVTLGSCGASAAQEALPATPAPSYTGAVNELAVRLGKDILGNHIATVAVIGGIGPDGKMTRLGDSLANALSENLSSQQAGFSVVARPALRAFLQGQRVSAFMLETDALAGWMTRKLSVDAYVALQIKYTKKNKAVLAAALFRQEGGKALASENAEVILEANEMQEGMQPLLLPQVPVSADVSKHPPACLNCGATRGGLKPGDDVSLNITILATGDVTEIFIRTPSTQEADGKAVEAVQGWKFTPAHDRSGNAVATTIQVMFHGPGR